MSNLLLTQSGGVFAGMANSNQFSTGDCATELTKACQADPAAGRGQDDDRHPPARAACSSAGVHCPQHPRDDFRCGGYVGEDGDAVRPAGPKPGVTSVKVLRPPPGRAGCALHTAPPSLLG